MIHISELHSYPIKSCGGISHESVEVNNGGLTLDREWMVVDSDSGKFISQRTHPKLALVRPDISHETMTVSVPDFEQLSVHLNDTDRPQLDTEVWRKAAPAIRQSPEADEWFSDYLQEGVQLVRKDPSRQRLVVSNRQIGDALNGVGFADGAPILLTNKSSLDKLNEDLDRPTTMGQFRPNIVVAGDLEAFDEDYWREFRAGPLDMIAAWACARCVMINIDQQSAVRNKTTLRALAESRTGHESGDTSERGAFFGQNIIPMHAGILNVGDTVSVTSRSNEPNVQLKKR